MRTYHIHRRRLTPRTWSAEQWADIEIHRRMRRPRLQPHERRTLRAERATFHFAGWALLLVVVYWLSAGIAAMGAQLPARTGFLTSANGLGKVHQADSTNILCRTQVKRLVATNGPVTCIRCTVISKRKP